RGGAASADTRRPARSGPPAGVGRRPFPDADAMGPDVPPGALNQVRSAKSDVRSRAARSWKSWKRLNAATAPTHRLRDIVEVVLVAVLLALYVRTFLLQAFVAPPPSMEDTVLVGDHLLVNKFIFAPHAQWEERLLPYRPVRRGDVIVFQFPQDPQTAFIKRAIALPGDTIEI